MAKTDVQMMVMVMMILSINQSIDQSINQSIKQASKQSINQAIKQSSNQAIKQSSNQSINPSVVFFSSKENEWKNQLTE